eukprot:XP_766172.1 hypothetical protein [Theileria parva strain Muguga]
MKCVNSNYSKYQKYFNICLREWYYQHKNGSYYYYANIPGILFTPLKINRRLNNSQILSNSTEWHFGQFPLTTLDNNCDIKKVLHIGYDTSFFKLFLNNLPEVSGTYNVIYCNTYDTLFNIYYNYSKKYKIDINSKFDNLRLLSGNLQTFVEPTVSSVSKTVKKKSKPPAKSKNIKTDKNFIDLLTGDKNTKAQTDTSFKLKEEICKSHVLKSLGGYKFISDNQFDNFVVSILPQ